MCRALAYLGAPVLLDHLLFLPDRSLVKQAYMPRMLRMLNLAGFGMAAWDDALAAPDRPLTYRSTQLPVFDPNLKALAGKLRPRCLLAHVRGVPYSTEAEVGPHNLHPFHFAGARLALAHNGDIAGMAALRRELAAAIAPGLLSAIRGTTDSEWLYALLLSFLDEPAEPAGPAEFEAIARAVQRMLSALRDARRRCGIEVASAANLFIADGRSITALRFCFDFGRYPLPAEHIGEHSINFLSLWYTSGREYGLHDGEWQMVGGSRADSVIVSSEPLTSDRSSWLEVPEYSLLHVALAPAGPVLSSRQLDG